MRFSEIYGHNKIKYALQKAVAEDRVGHAYIFEGQLGVGRMSTALAFAQLLVCESDKDAVNEHSGVACDRCKSCSMAETMSHPDIRVITNQLYDDKKKSKDVLVDTVRSMKQEIYIKPYMAKRKIYIVPAADTMNVYAQNSLLKVLEEPPEYCTIILIAENSNMFLQTILSRAQLFRFESLNRDIVAKYLQEKIPDMTSETARIKACMSGGSIGRAIELATDKEADEIRRDTIHHIMLLAENGVKGLYETVLFLKRNKNEIDFILGIMQDFFRDLMYLNGTGDTQNIMNTDMQNEIKRLNETVSDVAPVRMLETALKYSDYFSKNLSHALTVHCMASELWEVIHDRNYRS